jgi:hypothetical protein
MVTGQIYAGVDIPEYFITKPNYTPKELEERIARFFKFADAEALVNEYNKLPPEERLADAKKSGDEKVIKITLDTLFLER